MRSGIGNDAGDPVFVSMAAGGVASGTSTNPTIVSDSAAPKTDRSLAASTTSQQAAPAKPTRRRLLIQNLDAAINVHVNLGAAATTGAGSMRIAPGASMELTGSSEALNIIAASGAPSVTIWEF